MTELRPHFTFFALFFATFMVAQDYPTIEVFGGLGPSEKNNATVAQFAEEKPVLTANFGLGFTLPVSYRFSIRGSGHWVRYATSAIVTINDIIGSPPDSRWAERDNFVESFLLLRYRICDNNRWRMFAEAGLGSSLYLRSSTRITALGDRSIEVWPGESSRLESYRDLSLLTRLGVGASYEVSYLLDVFGVAAGQFYPFSILKDGSEKVRPWRLALEIGAALKIGI